MKLIRYLTLVLVCLGGHAQALEGIPAQVPYNWGGYCYTPCQPCGPGCCMPTGIIPCDNACGGSALNLMGQSYVSAIQTDLMTQLSALTMELQLGTANALAFEAAVTSAIIAQTTSQLVTDNRNTQAIVSAIKMWDQSNQNELTVLNKAADTALLTLRSEFTSALKSLSGLQATKQIERTFDPLKSNTDLGYWASSFANQYNEDMRYVAEFSTAKSEHLDEFQSSSLFALFGQQMNANILEDGRLDYSRIYAQQKISPNEYEDLSRTVFNITRPITNQRHSELDSHFSKNKKKFLYASVLGALKGRLAGPNDISGHQLLNSVLLEATLMNPSWYESIQTSWSIASKRDQLIFENAETKMLKEWMAKRKLRSIMSTQL